MKRSGDEKSVFWFMTLALVVVVWALYGRVGGYDFILYDDPDIVYANEFVSQGITVEGLRWAASGTGETNLWHPLTWLSHMVDVELFGVEKAGGHHLVNVFWHGVGAVGLFCLLVRLTGSLGVAFWLALVWAAHPLRVESVAWVSERKDVLSGAFFFWSWWSWEKWVAEKNRRWYGVSLGLFVLAALSKPSVVPLPAILWAGQLLRGERTVQAALAWGVRVAPFLAVAVVVGVLTMYLQRVGGLSDLSQVMPLERRIMLMPVSFWWYLQGFGWPGAGRFWVEPPKGQLSDWFWPGVGLCLVGGLVGWFGRKSSLVVLGGVVYLFLWLPVCGLVPVSYYYVADRYSYLIHVGVLVVLAGLLTAGWRRLEAAGAVAVKRVLLVAGVLLPMLMAGSSWQRLGWWKDSETFFSRERAVNPGNQLAPLQLGMVREEQGRAEEALALYREALANEPESGLAARLAGEVLVDLGRLAEAEVMLESAGEKKVLKNAASFRSLAGLRLKRGDLAGAKLALLGGLEKFPREVGVLLDLAALAHGPMAEPEEAKQWYRRLLETDPKHADAMQGLGVVLLETGEVAAGRKLLERLVQEYPDRINVKRFLESSR